MRRVVIVDRVYFMLDVVSRKIEKYTKKIETANEACATKQTQYNKFAGVKPEAETNSLIGCAF